MYTSMQDITYCIGLLIMLLIQEFGSVITMSQTLSTSIIITMVVTEITIKPATVPPIIAAILVVLSNKRKEKPNEMIMHYTSFAGTTL